jgi:hypothetical protein
MFKKPLILARRENEYNRRLGFIINTLDKRLSYKRRKSEKEYHQLLSVHVCISLLEGGYLSLL